MKRRKPDLLLVLAVLIGLGVVATSYAMDLGSQAGTPEIVSLSQQ